MLFILILIAAWLRLRPAEPPPTADGHAQPVETGPEVAARVPARAAAPSPPPSPAVDAGAPAALTAGADTRPDAHPDAPEEELRHPHPIDSAHMRIQRENNLLGALDGAMDVSDGPGMRRLLQQYRNEFPEDANELQTGYRIIADCLEYPGPVSTAAGQRYYDRERGSTLRRFVARHCLGQP